ncbi:S26 family signal peptidase, partial [Streptomyces sp. SID5770]|uniref:S26 family signal peptidase n=1 Tax=Streptomyces sp. SID5770 TaxID=2690308 RepID=UPI0031BA62F7
MQDTLQVGDRVLVNKLAPWFDASPQRGEIIVFRDPGGWLPPQPQESGSVLGDIQKGLTFVGLLPEADSKSLIKRVIAVGGDIV